MIDVRQNILRDGPAVFPLLHSCSSEGKPTLTWAGLMNDGNFYTDWNVDLVFERWSSRSRKGLDQGDEGFGAEIIMQDLQANQRPLNLEARQEILT